MATDPQAMSTAEAAAYLGLASRTLMNWRHLRQGPAFHKLGRTVRYDRADLDAFKAHSRVSLDGPAP